MPKNKKPDYISVFAFSGLPHFVYLPEAPLKIFFTLSVMHPLHNPLKALLHLGLMQLI
ncbi:hypothetical protein XNC3_1680002 [Xenorhabdus nematophila F1]|nr:hypothetical protein XNC3_1680002 [Xenorhabdus nematophila F1]